MLKNDVEIEISLAEVEVDDLGVVRLGDIIPVDGSISSGNVMIDQKKVTGESQLLDKIEGDKVLASTAVISGRAMGR